MRTRRLAAAERLIGSGKDEAEKENVEPPPPPSSSPEEAAASSGCEGEGEDCEDPDADKSRAVGILFLAHDGVTNPALWERWRESDPVSEAATVHDAFMPVVVTGLLSTPCLVHCRPPARPTHPPPIHPHQRQAYADRIRFFVFRNQKAAHAGPFVDRHDLGLRLRTKWCSASIVKATVESLRRVLLFDADVAMVYLVSGFDIPIQPPAALFRTRHVVTEGVPRAVVPFRTVLAFTPHDRDDAALRQADGWGKKGAHDDVKARLACHVQWCGLARAHVEKIVAYPDLPRLLQLGNRLSDHLCVCCLVVCFFLDAFAGAGEETPRPELTTRPSHTNTHTTSCPDEWVLGTVLALQGVGQGSPEVIDWPVTDQYRQRGKAQSPILWGDLDTTKARVFWAPPSCYRTFTLGAVLDTVSRREGNLFFRKVGPLTEAETARVLAPLLLLPPADAAVAGEKERGASSSSSSSSSSIDTRAPPLWEPEPALATAEDYDPASASEDDDDEEEPGPKPRKEEEELVEEEEREIEPSYSSASSVATAPTVAAASSPDGRSARRGKEEDVLPPASVPSTPQLQRSKRRAEGAERKRLGATAEEGDEEEGEAPGEGVVAAARSLRMVGPPGRCAGGRC